MSDMVLILMCTYDQGFLRVDDVITGRNGLVITADGAGITGDTMVDGKLTVTGTCWALRD